jgi:hypothetical protein
MVLYHDTTDRTFIRRMNASTWGAWREFVHVPQGAVQGNVLFRSATEWALLAPGTSGQVLRTNGAGANPSWATVSASPYTLLGTINTTSGTSQSLTSLVLTPYKFLRMVFNGVSGTAQINIAIDGILVAITSSAAGAIRGAFEIDLANGVILYNTPLETAATSYRTSTTSVGVTCTGGNFDAGSILVYGVA